MVQKPSKFNLPPYSTDEEIWIRILETLTPLERKEANKYKSEIKEPYPNCKEVTVRRTDKTEIAYAVRSEINKNGDEWAIYREI